MGPTTTGATPRRPGDPSPSQRERRERIVAAAIGLLGDREYERIQMRDVAESAGVALATLYRYFPSKEQLFAHALLEWSLGFEHSMRRGPVSGEPRERLGLLLRRAATAFERRPHFLRLVTLLDAVDDPAVRATFEEFAGRFVAVVTEALDGLDAPDVETIGALVLPLLSSELRQWSAGERSMTEVHLRLDAAVDLLFRPPRQAGVRGVGPEEADEPTCRADPAAHG